MNEKTHTNSLIRNPQADFKLINKMNRMYNENYSEFKKLNGIKQANFNESYNTKREKDNSRVTVTQNQQIEGEDKNLFVKSIYSYKTNNLTNERGEKQPKRGPVLKHFSSNKLKFSNDFKENVLSNYQKNDSRFKSQKKKLTENIQLVKHNHMNTIEKKEVSEFKLPRIYPSSQNTGTGNTATNGKANENSNTTQINNYNNFNSSNKVPDSIFKYQSEENYKDESIKLFGKTNFSFKPPSDSIKSLKVNPLSSLNKGERRLNSLNPFNYTNRNKTFFTNDKITFQNGNNKQNFIFSDFNENKYLDRTEKKTNYLQNKVNNNIIASSIKTENSEIKNKNYSNNYGFNDDFLISESKSKKDENNEELNLSDFACLLSNKPETCFDISNVKDRDHFVCKNSITTKEFSYLQDQNHSYKTKMEDFGKAIEGIYKNFEYSIFGLYDGHGGQEIARYCKEYMNSNLKNQFERIHKLIQTINEELLANYKERKNNKEKIKETYIDSNLKTKRFSDLIKESETKFINNIKLFIKSAFWATDEGSKSLKNSNAGSTASLIFIIQFFTYDNNSVFSSKIKEEEIKLIPIKKRIIFSSNIGDSSSYMVDENNDVKAISEEHTCSNPNEDMRICSSGGRILYGRVMGELIVTRAFGDHKLKKFGVSSEPFTFSKVLTNSNKWIIMASDGIWDTINRYDLICNTKNVNSSEEMNKYLVKLAKTRGSKDNISCFVIKL